MIEKLLGFAVTFLMGVFGFILNVKKENKGFSYKLIRDALWILCGGSILGAIGVLVYTYKQVYFKTYLVSIFVLMGIGLLFLCVYRSYKYYKITSVLENEQENRTVNEEHKSREGDAGIIVFNSNKDYNDNINPLEENAKEIITLTKRINIVFKPDKLIHEIAEQRFGHDSFELERKNNYEVYVNAHKVRKRAFFDYLDSGKTYYEIYCASDLIKYIETFYHNGTENLDKKYLKEEIEIWMETIKKYDNYHVIICYTEGVVIPIKYKIYDRKFVVIHDSVGKHPQNRVNSFMISDPIAVEKFVKDFEVLWNLSNSQNQTNELVCKWIKENLINRFKEIEND